MGVINNKIPKLEIGDIFKCDFGDYQNLFYVSLLKKKLGNSFLFNKVKKALLIKRHEQEGARPAIVVSASGFNKYTDMIKVVPVTTKAKANPFHVDIPKRLELNVYGQALVEQELSIDPTYRYIRYLGSCPLSIMRKINELICLSYHNNLPRSYNE